MKVSFHPTKTITKIIETQLKWSTTTTKTSLVNIKINLSSFTTQQILEISLRKQKGLKQNF